MLAYKGAEGFDCPIQLIIFYTDQNEVCRPGNRPWFTNAGEKGRPIQHGTPREELLRALPLRNGKKLIAIAVVKAFGIDSANRAHADDCGMLYFHQEPLLRCFGVPTIVAQISD